MPGRGLEPLRIAPPDPKSGASANFATLAERDFRDGTLGDFTGENRGNGGFQNSLLSRPLWSTGLPARKIRHRKRTPSSSSSRALLRGRQPAGKIRNPNIEIRNKLELAKGGNELNGRPACEKLCASTGLKGSETDKRRDHLGPDDLVCQYVRRKNRREPNEHPSVRLQSHRHRSR